MPKLPSLLLIALLIASPIPAMTESMDSMQLLDQTQALACRYFVEQTLENGLVRDTSRASDTKASIAATGFGLAVLCILAERYETSPHWQTSPEQAERLASTAMRTLDAIQSRQAEAPERFGTHGFFYHFIDSEGNRVGRCEVSTVDTALLMAGMMTAAVAFGGKIEAITERIWNRLDWSYFLRPAKDPPFEDAQQFSHGWSPEHGRLRATWDRPTDEGMLIQLLALAQQPDNLDYQRAFFGWQRVMREYQGFPVVNSYFGSLFTYLFAHCFYDFRALGTDKPERITGIPSSVPSVDWWENSVNAALANRAFCIQLSDRYPWLGENAWGLTACYDPDGAYLGELGAEPAERTPFHNGTLPPYGAISCLPFFECELEQNLAFSALKHYRETYGDELWGRYGPYDAIHPERPKTVARFYVGIDVGPMAIMIENYRTGRIWQHFMAYPGILDGAHRVFADH